MFFCIFFPAFHHRALFAFCYCTALFTSTLLLLLINCRLITRSLMNPCPLQKQRAVNSLPTVEVTVCVCVPSNQCWFSKSHKVIFKYNSSLFFHLISRKHFSSLPIFSWIYKLSETAAKFRDHSIYDSAEIIHPKVTF